MSAAEYRDRYVESQERPGRPERTERPERPAGGQHRGAPTVPVDDDTVLVQNRGNVPVVTERKLEAVSTSAPEPAPESVPEPETPAAMPLATPIREELPPTPPSPPAQPVPPVVPEPEEPEEPTAGQDSAPQEQADPAVAERGDSDDSGDSGNGRIPSYRIVGEVFRSYVIVETDDKMLLIDKHAAHERILFEQLKAGLRETEVVSQMLMIPVEVMLTGAEVEALHEYESELEKIGFSVRFARNTVSVDAIPEGVESNAVADMLGSMAGRILNATGNVRLTRDIIFEKALYQAACKAAIKAGRTYADEHIAWIVQKLMEIPDITFCPHGRPVALELSHHTLDKQFDRTGF
jgi:DNA mismatch repair protein MutL